MINSPHPSVVLNTLATYIRVLPLFTFVILALMLVEDADARTRTDRTAGGTTTDLHDHGIRVRCTWPDFQGDWTSNSEHPISVSHSVGINNSGEYATCSGWNVYDDGSDNVQYLEDGTTVNHELSIYGSGKFLFEINYTSSTTTTCIEDPNSGIGNNCVKFTDEQNKKHGGADPVPTSGATLACSDNSPGTTLTYQFFCADGVDVEGQLTLVPSLDGGITTQAAPNFTGPCSPERVEAGACTHVYGGVPTKTVKIKGQTVTVIDTKACLAAFPEASVDNALGSGQEQLLAPNALLVYVETAYTGSCDSITDLPTDEGSATAAYGRYCTSDIDTFEDNLAGNVYSGDLPDSDGFDNELRVCEETNKNGPHTGGQDIETVELVDIIVDNQPTLNLNCESGNGSNDSGVFKVWISDQAQLLARNIEVNPISDAPKLEGISPTKAVINTDDFGVDTLELVYPSCPMMSAVVIENNNLDSTSNNSNVMLNLTGDVQPTATSLSQTINAMFEIKVNGL